MTRSLPAGSRANRWKPLLRQKSGRGVDHARVRRHVLPQELHLVGKEVDAERNLLLVKGAVPGSENGQVVVRAAVKATKATTATKAAVAK